MQLNLPIFEQLSSCKNLLIAGMGGGFDIFCGLPIYFELQRREQNAHLANLSFSAISTLKDGIRLTPTLVGVGIEHQGMRLYFPERYLAQWFKEKRQADITIWCFQKAGAIPLVADYHRLAEHLSLDGILLIDGGVDSLVRGDEAQTGTAVDDALSLLAVSELNQVPMRLMGCLGLGAERHITHSHILENIAALAEAGGFLGACSLVSAMEAYRLYEEAVLYVYGKQEASNINSSVISAVQGHFGDYHLTEKIQAHSQWISPLMALYWFFDLKAVAERNLILSRLRSTETFTQAFDAFHLAWKATTKRAPVSIPLP